MANPTGTNAYQKSAQTGGYSNTPMVGSPNQTEAWALVEAARRMAAAIEEYSTSDTPGSPKTREMLRDPLRLNWRLWTIFQAELINSMDDKDNPMPDDIRTNMLTLCQFVDKHTTQALADPQPEYLAVLIDLNRNIATGLFETPETPLEEAAQPVHADDAPDQEPAAPSSSVVGGSISEEI